MKLFLGIVMDSYTSEDIMLVSLDILYDEEIDINCLNLGSKQQKEVRSLQKTRRNHEFLKDLLTLGVTPEEYHQHEDKKGNR